MNDSQICKDLYSQGIIIQASNVVESIEMDVHLLLNAFLLFVAIKYFLKLLELEKSDFVVANAMDNGKLKVIDVLIIITVASKDNSLAFHNFIYFSTNRLLH